MGILDRVKKLFNEHTDEVISVGAKVYHGVTGKKPDENKFKMIVLDHDKDLVTKVIEVSAKDVLDAKPSYDADSLTGMLFSGSEMLQDEAVQELFTYFGLRDPQKLAKFLVELHLAQIDSFNDSFDLLADLHTNDYNAEMKDGRTYFKQAQRALTEEERRRKLEMAMNCFMEARHRYEETIKTYIKNVQTIVGKRKFFRGSRALEKLDGFMQKLQGLIEAEQEAVQLEHDIAQLMNESVIDAVDEYREFFEKTLKPNLTLLQRCSKDEDESFWKDIEENGDVILVMG